MNILVSACLLGLPCKYNGKSNENPFLREWAARSDFCLVPVCPECYGGLPTPRPACELRDGRVISKTGQDVTEAFGRGAEAALSLARLYGCRYAVLKERSPSCSCSGVYDGSFSGRLIPGQGLAARLLGENGVHLYGESEAPALFKALLTEKDPGSGSPIIAP